METKKVASGERLNSPFESGTAPDAIRNITGYVSRGGMWMGFDNAKGAFVCDTSSGGYPLTGGYMGYSGFYLESSLVVPTDLENSSRALSELVWRRVA